MTLPPRSVSVPVAISAPSRRRMLQLGAAGMLAATLPQPARAGEFAGRIKKAVKYHMISEKLSPLDKLKMLQDIGFDGVEPRAMLQPDQASEVRALRAASEQLDFPIHGVVHSSNPNIADAIDQAKSYGANSVLHVVRYDTKIGYLQNYRETQEIIRKAVDHAERNEVYILLENVWASYLIEPLGMARFVDEINSPFVQVYFDVGNVVRWGWPQHWLEVLGKRAKKLDIKEFDLKVAMNEGMRKAFDTPLGEGSIEWPKVREQLRKLDYRGWATAEVRGGDRERLAEIAAQMDRVLDLK
ncbi:MAG: TIM barrel protein [Planctomycetales bacterium]|nr:TIM barrel protein [Planctomycetales bacterium]